jgi:hypothetical protein
MNYTALSNSFSLTAQVAAHLRWARAGLAALLVCVWALLAVAEPSDPLRYRGGVRNSNEERYRLNEKQLQAVLASLREKSGFLDMDFDDMGFLTLGDRTRFAGGSAAARALLIAAVDSHKSLVLENHSRSATLAFACLGSATVYESRLTGARIEAYPVQIDFADFAQLRGRKEVLSAFDLGFVILHELAHGALELPDAERNSTGIGECEGYINRIRRELGLPERQHYVARVQRIIPPPGQRSFQRAELRFAHWDEERGQLKQEHLYLGWESEKVGFNKILSSPKPASAARAATAWQP